MPLIQIAYTILEVKKLSAVANGFVQVAQIASQFCQLEIGNKMPNV